MKLDLRPLDELDIRPVPEPNAYRGISPALVPEKAGEVWDAAISAEIPLSVAVKALPKVQSDLDIWKDVNEKMGINLTVDEPPPERGSIIKESAKGLVRGGQFIAGHIGGTIPEWAGDFVAKAGYTIKERFEFKGENIDRFYSPLSDAIISSGEGLSKFGKESRERWLYSGQTGWEAINYKLKEHDPIAFYAGKVAEGVPSSALSVLSMWLSGGSSTTMEVGQRLLPHVNRGLVALSAISAAGGYQHAKEQGENFTWSTLHGLADGLTEYAMESNFLDGIRDAGVVTAGLKEGFEEIVTGGMQNTRAGILERVNKGMPAYQAAKEAVKDAVKQMPIEGVGGFIGGFGISAGMNMSNMVTNALSPKAIAKFEAEQSQDAPTPKPEGKGEGKQTPADSRAESKALRARGDLTMGKLGQEAQDFEGTGGIASENKAQNFRPAFRHKTTGELFEAKDENGRLSGVHLLSGIPDKYVTKADPEDGYVLAVSGDIEAGFIRDGKFFTRDEAADLTPKPEGKGEDVSLVAPQAEALPEDEANEEIGGLIQGLNKKPVPPKGKKKERKFITSVKEEFPDLATRVSGEYVPRGTDRLAQKARTLIQEDIDSAEKLARTRTDDAAIAVASELIKHYNEKAQKATDQDKGVYYDRAADIANTTAEKLTELGRAVQAASILSRLTPEGLVRFAAKTINNYNEQVHKKRGGLFGLRKKVPNLTGEQVQSLTERAHEIIEMEDGPEKAMAWWKLQEEISQMTPSPALQKVLNVWKAGLLTGIKTSGLNTIANLNHGVSESIKDIPAAAVDSVASLFTGKRTLGLTLRESAKGTIEGFTRGWQYLHTGYDARNVAAKFDFKKVHYGNSRFGKWVQAYEEAVFGMLGAEDQPFYYRAKGLSLASQAIAQAKNKGLKGKEAKAFIDNAIANPTDEMIRYAVFDAETAVFINRTVVGDIARQIQKVPLAEFIIPFARTPSAIAMQIVNYSPAGAVKALAENIGKGRFDQRMFSQAMGRAATGTAAMYLGGELLKAGLLSLGRPKDEREKKLWELEGRKENAIKIGGKWRSVQTLGPVGNVMVVGGYFFKALQETGSPTQAVVQAIGGAGKSFSEETYVAGLRKTLDLFEDPPGKAETWFSSFAGSFIPTIVSDIARASDSTERRSIGPVQRIQSRIPKLREKLEPRLNVFGQDVPRYGGNTLEIMIDPTRPFKINQDAVVDELRRLWDKGVKVSPTMLGDKKGYEALDPKQNTKLWRRAGDLTYHYVFNIVTSDAYKSITTQSEKITNVVKGQYIEAEVKRAKDQARWEMVMELTEEGRNEKKMREIMQTDLFPAAIGEIPLLMLQEQSK